MTIKPTQKNGRKQWRVSWQECDTQRRKFFGTKSEAIQFSETLHAGDSSFARWMALPESARMEAIVSAERAQDDGFSLVEAVDYFARRAGVIDVEARRAWAQYLAVKREIRGASAESLKNARIAGRFVDEIPSLSVSSISSDQIEQWITTHDWSPSSINTFRAQLGAFLTWCIGKGYLDKSPLTSIPKALETETEVGILSVSQSEQLMRACETHDRDLIPIAALGLFCGLRPSECHRLTWDDINLPHKIITMRGATARKTRKGRMIHITPNAEAWLALGGKMAPQNFRRRWDCVRESAGLIKRIRIENQRRYEIENIHWPKDCLRHSFASYYTGLHGIPAAALECGNSEQVQIKNYRQPVAKDKCQKYFAIYPSGEPERGRAKSKLA